MKQIKFNDPKSYEDIEATILAALEYDELVDDEAAARQWFKDAEMEGDVISRDLMPYCISVWNEEHQGSAGYTNGRSDMGQTAAVIESSMGPRREPMTVITTTASLITSGPFMEMLEATHRLLLQELKYLSGEAVPTLAEDRQQLIQAKIMRRT